MNHPNRSNTLIILIVLTLVGALTCAGLWLMERDRKPKEIVKVVEKPVQVVKEVPVELTEDQKAAIYFTHRYEAAKFIETRDEALFNLETIQVEVHLNDEIKKVVSEDRVRNKFELILRKHGVKIDEKSPFYVFVVIDGLRNESSKFLVLSTSLQLRQYVVVPRNLDFRMIFATLWENGSYGIAGTQAVEGAILEAVEEMGESFANKYLAAQEKNK